MRRTFGKKKILHRSGAKIRSPQSFRFQFTRIFFPRLIRTCASVAYTCTRSCSSASVFSARMHFSRSRRSHVVRVNKSNEKVSARKQRGVHDEYLKPCSLALGELFRLSQPLYIRTAAYMQIPHVNVNIWNLKFSNFAGLAATIFPLNYTFMRILE